MRMFGLRHYDSEPVDPDLPEHLRAIYTAEWVHLIARLDTKAARKSVAWALSSFASEDGSDVRPALSSVGDICHLHETSVAPHIKVLLKLGLLVVKRPGGGRSNPTEYRLTRPADLTTLPLWLDADLKRIPAGGAFVPVETPAPTLGNEDASNTDSPADAPPNTYSPAFTKGVYESESPAPTLPFEAETPAPTLGNRPVDNFAEPVNPSVFDPKPQRFGPENPETPAPTLGDLLQADPTTDQPGLPQATTSLGRPGVGPPPTARAEVVEPPDDAPWTPEPEAAASSPPSPARPTAGIAAAHGATPAVAGLYALLGAQPNGGEFFLAAAARELRRDGIAHPRQLDIAIRAVAILRRAQPAPETRSA